MKANMSIDPVPPVPGLLLNKPRRIVRTVFTNERQYRCKLMANWNAPEWMGATIEDGWTELSSLPE